MIYNIRFRKGCACVHLGGVHPGNREVEEAMDWSSARPSDRADDAES